MDSAEAVAARLEEVFDNIYRTRMQDVPIVNTNLSVQAVGFRRHDDYWAGILITPWFMNLMLLSAEQEPVWTDGGVGDSVKKIFPAGRFEFLQAEEPALGRILMCSLFSPMFEFADHDSAVIAAEAAVEAVFTSDDAPAQPAPDGLMYSLAKGEGPMADMSRHLGASKPEPEVSRRRILTGGRSEGEATG